MNSSSITTHQDFIRISLSWLIPLWYLILARVSLLTLDTKDRSIRSILDLCLLSRMPLYSSLKAYYSSQPMRWNLSLKIIWLRFMQSTWRERVDRASSKSSRFSRKHHLLVGCLKISISMHTWCMDRQAFLCSMKSRQISLTTQTCPQTPRVNSR